MGLIRILFMAMLWLFGIIFAIGVVGEKQKEHKLIYAVAMVGIFAILALMIGGKI